MGKGPVLILGLNVLSPSHSGPEALYVVLLKNNVPNVPLQFLSFYELLKHNGLNNSCLNRYESARRAILFLLWTSLAQDWHLYIKTASLFDSYCIIFYYAGYDRGIRRSDLFVCCKIYIVDYLIPTLAYVFCNVCEFLNFKLIINRIYRFKLFKIFRWFDLVLLLLLVMRLGLALLTSSLLTSSDDFAYIIRFFLLRRYRTNCQINYLKIMI